MMSSQVLETLKISGMPPIEQVTTISAHIFHYKQELTKLEAMRDEVLDSMIRRHRKPSKSLPVSKLERKLLSKREKQSAAGKKVGKLRAEAALAAAKTNVLAALKGGKSMLVSEIEGRVPHSHPTVRLALDKLKKEGLVSTKPTIDSRNRPGTLWMTA